MAVPPQMEKRVKGLAKGIIEEMVRADLTMHEMQIEEWARIARHRPKGDDIPADIMKGFGKDQYLSLMEVDLSLHVKPRPTAFFKRLKFAFKVLFGRSLLNEKGRFIYDLCHPDDKEAEPMNLKIQRLEDGKLKATYRPIDEETSVMMEE